MTEKLLRPLSLLSPFHSISSILSLINIDIGLHQLVSPSFDNIKQQGQLCHSLASSSSIYSLLCSIHICSSQNLKTRGHCIWNMSPLPLTPSKGNQKREYHAAQIFLGSNERAASSSKSKLNFLNEPSPASTYGETAESSMPATPFNPDCHGKLCSLRSLCRLFICQSIA